MKILTGTLRGRSITLKPNAHLRPTADKVRKAVFDMLQGAIEGRNVLDLYSGTGALGLEALSQGAAKVTFVEIDKVQARRIGDNLAQLGVADRARVMPVDALRAIGELSAQGEYFDFIFLDPPYETGLAQKTLQLLASSRLVHETTLVLTESGRGEAMPRAAGALRLFKTKRYGDTQLSLFRVAEPDSVGP